MSVCLCCGQTRNHASLFMEGWSDLMCSIIDKRAIIADYTPIDKLPALFKSTVGCHTACRLLKLAFRAMKFRHYHTNCCKQYVCSHTTKNCNKFHLTCNATILILATLTSHKGAGLRRNAQPTMTDKKCSTEWHRWPLVTGLHLQSLFQTSLLP